MKCVHVYWISHLKEGQLIEKSEYFIWDESRPDVCDIASVQCISMVQFTSSDQWNQSTVLETQTLGAYPSPCWGGGFLPTPLDADPPAHVTCDACWQASPPLWTEWLTHACENTTLPQTSAAGGNKWQSDLLVDTLSGEWLSARGGRTVRLSVALRSVGVVVIQWCCRLVHQS